MRSAHWASIGPRPARSSRSCSSIHRTA
jgi:hypothetical protein